MKSTTIGRTLTGSLAGPLVAAGILLGSMVIGDAATASAEPTTDGQCTSMPMAEGEDRTVPNPLTNPAGVIAATGPSASDGSMPVTCAPASHG